MSEKNQFKAAGWLAVASAAVGAVLGGVCVDQYHRDRIKGPELHPEYYTQVTVEASPDTQVYFRKSVDDDKPWRPFPTGKNPSMLLEKCIYDFKVQQLGSDSAVKQRVLCNNPTKIALGTLERQVKAD